VKEGRPEPEICLRKGSPRLGGWALTLIGRNTPMAIRSVDGGKRRGNLVKKLPENPIYELDGATFEKLQDNCVYAWVRGEDVLYVGHSSQGLRRLASHNVIDNMEPVQPEDKIVFWEVSDDWWKGEDFEGRIMTMFEPKYNSFTPSRKAVPPICVRCGKKFRQRAVWQKFCSFACRTPRRSLAEVG